MREVEERSCSREDELVVVEVEKVEEVARVRGMWRWEEGGELGCRYREVIRSNSARGALHSSLFFLMCPFSFLA